MSIYKYSALDEQNSIINGQVEASSQNEAREIILTDGKKPIKISEDLFAKNTSRSISLKKVSGDEIAVFCKQLSIITRSGISIIKGLYMVRDQTNSKKIKELSENLHTSIQKGCSISEAFRNCGYRLPLLLINMVEVGEVSGNLDDIFKKMAEYFEKESRTRKKVIGAMIYPIILLCVSMGVIALFTFFILPSLVEIFEDTGVPLPLLTKIMMGSANFVVENILYISIGAVIVVTVYLKAIPYNARRKFFNSLIFKIPAVNGVAKDFMTSRFTRTMGILIQTGLSMLTTLETLEKVIGNDVVSRGIANTRDNINKGESLSVGLEQMKFFDNMVINIIAIGEDTGNLCESMLDLADYYDEKFDSGVARLISLIEPIFTLGMGGVIAVILLSAMLPMFDMIGSISGGN